MGYSHLAVFIILILICGALGGLKGEGNEISKKEIKPVETL